MRINQAVCFITGTGHSGSTLLGLLLGNHSQSFYCGEGKKSRYLHRESSPLRKRTCKFCGTDCPVWGQFHLAPDHDLYEQLARHIHATLGSTASIMIDSTSNPDWIHDQCAKLAATTAQPYLIFLKRDGRGVINSYQRKYPERDLEIIIESWLKRVQKAQIFFNEFTGPKIIIHYEDLATNTCSVLQRLCEFLDIPYEPEMRDFSRQIYHILGGNNGTQFLVARHELKFLKNMNLPTRHYYQTHQSDIVLDLRWQQELSPAQQQMFARLAGDINQSFAWHPQP